MQRQHSLTALLCIFIAQNLAAESAHHSINWWQLGSEHSEAPALGWLTITFLIFVFVVYRAIRKPLGIYLETRSKDIAKSIAEARKAKEESEEKFRIYDEKMKTLAAEIKNLEKNFLEQASLEKTEKERMAQELRARLLRDAEDNIRSSRERLRNRLLEEHFNNAMEHAQDLFALDSTKYDKELRHMLIKDLRIYAKEVPQ
jgi:F0F1-type ATP synthase membrane subunit b/b'